MLACSLPVFALIWTALLSNTGSVLSQNASDFKEFLVAAGNLSQLKEGTEDATAKSNVTRRIDGAVDRSECFYFCPTWTNVVVIVILILLLTCLCGAITQHQPREIWYVVDRSGEVPRPGGELPMPPKMSGPQPQIPLRSPQP